MKINNPTTFSLPAFHVVVMVGVAGSGKSRFAKQHFPSTQIISSDQCRAMICDQEHEQAVSREAFDLGHDWLRKRLSFGRSCVFDATHTTREARQPILNICNKYGVSVIACVLDMPLELALKQNNERNRRVPEHIIHQQYQELQQDMASLYEQGFEKVYRFETQHAANASHFQIPHNRFKRPLATGPFDIIGDIHGCFDELVALIKKLGYRLDYVGPSLHQAIQYRVTHSENRQLIFLGDLCDRGPLNRQALTMAMDLCDQGIAICLMGNHEAKLRLYLQGKPVPPTHGLDRTIADLAPTSQGFKNRVRRFLDQLPPHLVLDQGQLVVAHAGLKAVFHGHGGSKAKNFALYGDVGKGKDSYGFPIRGDWAADYTGSAEVVYGHTPFTHAVWRNRTICLDTGCVFGGKLTALRYPERELLSVKARDLYWKPVKTLGQAPKV